MLSFLSIVLLTLISWSLILAGLFFLKSYSRPVFVLSHYVLDIIVFGIAFLIYYKYFGKFTPFKTMAIAMVFLFITEFIYWKFFYTGELWFLNFVDWIIPAFLVATTIYFVGIYFNKI